MRTDFYIDKSTGTFADELLAAGFIAVLKWLYHWQGAQQPIITQIDGGYRYIIECDPPLNLKRVVAETQPFYPAPVIRTAKNQTGLPDLPPAAVVSYEDEKEKRNQYLEAYKNLDKTAKRADIIGEAHAALESLPPAPHPHWDVFRMINPAALVGYNGLMTQWYEVGAAGQAGTVSGLLCRMFSQSPNDVGPARDAWREIAKANNWKMVDASSSQFYNPSQGKGVNRPQPDGVGPGNLDNFWLLEWLKAVGLYEIGFTRTLQGVGDRKTYVPVYGRMSPPLPPPSMTIFATGCVLVNRPCAPISSRSFAIYKPFYQSAGLTRARARKSDGSGKCSVMNIPRPISCTAFRLRFTKISATPSPR